MLSAQEEGGPTGLSSTVLCLCAPEKPLSPPCLMCSWEEGGSISLGSCIPSLFGLQGELVTASKAIIEKEYQPHVIVSTTGPNPFNTLTDRELEEYRREVERKQKGSEGECS